MPSKKAAAKSGTTKKRKTLTVKQKAKGKQEGIEKAKLVTTGITPDQRSRMIAEAAYYRAEKRGFDPEGQVRDWLEAESEVDTMLSKSAQKRGEVSH